MLQCQYRAWHPSESIVPVPVYKAERVASGLRCRQSLHKDNKILRDFQICTISRRRLTLSAIGCVRCRCVSIASTSVMPEHGHRCRCKVRASTRTPICSQGIAHPAAKFRHTLPGVVRRFRPFGVGSQRVSPLLDCGLCLRRIRARPSRQSNLRLRYGREICHRNFPNKALFKKVHDSMKNVIRSQK